MAGVPRDQLRPARILLTACGMATLALNIAEPVTAGAYGRAAFDSVGPGLLIGWAETGPGRLRFLYARPSRPDPALHGGELRPAPADEELTTASAPLLDGPGSKADGSSRPGTSQAGRSAATGLDELLAEARRIDQAHRHQHHRPVSAETLRRQMRIGSMRARVLVQQVRGSQDPAAQRAEAPERVPHQMDGGHSCAESATENRQPDLARELAVTL